MSDGVLMVSPHKVAIPLGVELSPISESELLGKRVSQWPPITVFEGRVTSGVQRVLVARKHGITLIPVRYI